MQVPVVNPDPSTEDMTMPDTESELEAMPEWDSSPNGDPPILTIATPNDIFRTMPPVRILGRDGQPVADAPSISPEEYIEWEGSPEWTTWST